MFPPVFPSWRRTGALAFAGTLMATTMAAAMPSAGFVAMGMLARQGGPPLEVVRYYHHSSRHARRDSKPAAAAAPAAPVSAKPALVGTYGDWGVYVSQSAKTKVCYALGQPNARAPSSIKKDGAYVFISNRPGEGVHNEVSIMAGLPLKEGAVGGKAEIGGTAYDLVAKGQNAFVKNAAEEGQFVGTLKRRGAKLVLKLPTSRSSITDTYSLAGVQDALNRVAKECP